MTKTEHKILGQVMKRVFSKSFLASLILGGFFVYGLINLHPFTESWAWEIARDLITVDGLILGFTILGITVVAERAAERRSSLPRMTSLLKKFIAELKAVAQTSHTKIDVEKVEKSILTVESAMESAIVDIIFPYSIFVAMYNLLGSLLLAFTLFGVSDATVSNPVTVEVFRIVIAVSLSLLIFGFHLTIQVLLDFTTKPDSKEAFKKFKEAIHGIEQDLKERPDTRKE